MSHSIATFSSHNLNLNSLSGLAKDLSNRLSINIEFGYYAEKHLSKLLGEDTSEGIVILGKETANQSDECFWLTEYNYQKKQVLNKLGEEALLLPQYWNGDSPSDSELPEEINTLQRKAFDLELDTGKDLKYMFIYQHHLMNQINYLGSWNYLSSFFEKESSFFGFSRDIQELEEYRAELQKTTRLLGGEEVYMLDDQGKDVAYLTQGGGDELTWNEFKLTALNKAKDAAIYLSHFVTNNDYKERVIPYTVRPQLLIDDFADLRP